MKSAKEQKGLLLLSNNKVFIGVIVLSITVLTAINNFYFYSHIARENGRNAEKIKLIIEEKLAFCSDNNISSKVCNQSIVTTVGKVSKYYYYLSDAELYDANGELLWKKHGNSHDKVAALKATIRLPDLSESKKATYEISNVWSNYNVAVSVYRSMTFSATELMDISYKDGIEKAIKRFTTVAWYRSRPAIGFAIFTFVLLWLFRKHQVAQLRKIKERDQELIDNIGTLQEDLEVYESTIIRKFQLHDGVINPPLNTLKYEDYLQLDPETIVFKCRKVMENIVTKLYYDHIEVDKFKSVYEKINALNKKGILDSRLVTYAHSLRAVGNNAVHNDILAPIVFTRDDALVNSSVLILFIEGLEEQGLTEGI